MPKKKTQEEFEKEVYDLTNGEYKVIGEYKNTKTHIMMKHDIESCGYEYPVSPYHFLDGSRCPQCFGNFKKTTEQYKQEIYNLVNDEYSVLGEYTGAHDKILLKHNNCNYEWDVDASSFLQGCRCPNCFGNIKKTHEQFCQEVYQLVGDEYEVCSEYINSSTNIKLLHKTCNNYINIEPNFFLSGTRCGHCFGNKKKTTEDFKKELYELEGNDYILLSEYINNHTDIILKHNIDYCGFEYPIRPSNFLTGNRCPKCTGRYRTTDEFKEMVNNLYGEEYSILGDYINSIIPLLIKHNICGASWETTPNKILSGEKCPECFKFKRTHEDFVEWVKENTNNEYIVLSTYINANTHILMKHNISECGHEWNVYPTNFMDKNTRCPSCAKRKENNPMWINGEQSLSSYLRQFTYEWRTNLLQKYHYKCFVTGKIGSQKIHHLYGFNMIVNDILNELNLDKRKYYTDYSNSELRRIEYLCKQKHTNDIGIVICGEIHNLFHKQYGRKNNTPIQFNDFIFRLKNNEFDNFLFKSNLKLVI